MYKPMTIGAVLAHKEGSMIDVKRWLSAMPEECDMCHTPLKGKAFVDGKTAFGPWAMMCEICHRDQGFGLGTGKGQKYDKTGVKIGG
jgi:hypothetical protein